MAWLRKWVAMKVKKYEYKVSRNILLKINSNLMKQEKINGAKITKLKEKLKESRRLVSGQVSLEASLRG